MLSRTLAVAKLHDLRQHPRVPLVLWVRVRWLGAFGLEQEISETIDTGRGGLLTSSALEHAVGAPAWVTFPYDANAAEATPEFPSRVAHCRAGAEGTHLIGLEFLSNADSAHAGHNGSGHRKSFWRLFPKPTVSPLERRCTSRTPLALPVTIRRSSTPFPDETITTDISSHGISFSTVQVYESGEPVFAELPAGRWAASGHHDARVVRVSGAKGDSRLQTIAIQFS